MKEKKGLSAIVTTLIIILLAIVALGVVWTVVRNVTDNAQDQVELGSKCRDVELSATRVVNTTAIGTGYDVTLKRTGSGEEEIGGVKVVLLNSTAGSSVLDFGVAIDPLQTVTQTLDLTGQPVVGADTIETTVYFVSDLGEEQLCPNTKTTEF